MHGRGTGIAERLRYQPGGMVWGWYADLGRRAPYDFTIPHTRSRFAIDFGDCTRRDEHPGDARSFHCRRIVSWPVVWPNPGAHLN